ASLTRGLGVMRCVLLAATGTAILAASLALPSWPEAAAEAPKKGTPSVRTDTATGLELVQLPGGTFRLGCEPQDTDCSEAAGRGRKASVGPMWLGKTEVTVEAYARCVTAGACTAPATGGACNWGVAGRERHPVNCVDWSQANAFCARAGG